MSEVYERMTRGDMYPNEGQKKERGCSMTRSEVTREKNEMSGPDRKQNIYSLRNDKDRRNVKRQNVDSLPSATDECDFTSTATASKQTDHLM